MSALERDVSALKATDFLPTHRDVGDLLALTNAYVDLRRSREIRLGHDLFGDPAWDILLVLYQAKLQQVRLNVSCIIGESRVPSTTALRWISALVERGFAHKCPNPMDARVSFVEMDDRTALVLSRYFYEFRRKLRAVVC